MSRAFANTIALFLLILTLLALPRLYNALYAIRWVPPRPRPAEPVRVAPEDIPEEQAAPKFKFFTGKENAKPR